MYIYDGIILYDAENSTYVTRYIHTCVISIKFYSTDYDILVE